MVTHFFTGAACPGGNHIEQDWREIQSVVAPPPAKQAQKLSMLGAVGWLVLLLFIVEGLMIWMGERRPSRVKTNKRS